MKHKLIPLSCKIAKPKAFLKFATPLAMANLIENFELLLLIRVVDSVVTLYGVGIILYCLWFLKTWKEKTVGLPFSTTPWFIHVCLAIGIALCVGTTCGCVVANCFSNCMLSTYIVVTCCLLLLEIAVVVTIFITMDWVTKVNESIQEKYSNFRVFVLFHLCTCRIILLVSLIPQITAIALAICPLALGNQAPRSGCGHPFVITDLRQSFLVLPSSSVHEDSPHFSSHIDGQVLSGEEPERGKRCNGNQNNL